jgi:hypothetical protein
VLFRKGPKILKQTETRLEGDGSNILALLLGIAGGRGGGKQAPDSPSSSIISATTNGTERAMGQFRGIIVFW